MNAMLSNVMKSLSRIHINPDVKMYAGMAMAAAGTVTACVATTKLSGVIEEHLERLKNVRETVDEREIGKATVVEYGRTMWNVTKLYAAPAAMIIGGNALMHNAHIDLKKTNLGLAASVVSLESELDNAFNRLVGEVGEDEAKRIFAGGKKVIETIEETDENGKTHKKKQEVVKYNDKPLSPDAFLFDESNKNWEKAHLCNYRFVMNQLHYAQDKLDARNKNGHGWLTKNEVLDLLDMEPVADGFVRGWRGGDIISFGVEDERCRGFREGDERNVWLVLNCNPEPLGIDLRKDIIAKL